MSVKEKNIYDIINIRLTLFLACTTDYIRGNFHKVTFIKNKEKIRLFGEIFRTLVWALNVLKDYKVRLYSYIFCLVMHSVYKIYMTSKVGSIVDLALEDNVEKLLKTGGAFVALYVINVLITIACNRFASLNYNRMYNDLEMKAYRKIMDASWEGLSDYHSGDLLTRLSSDIKTVAGNTSGLVPTMIANLTLILGAGVFIVYLDYSMIFLALIICPVVIIASRIFMGKIYQSEARIREIESRINSCNIEAFNNIQAIKAFDLGNQFYDQMNDIEKERKKVDLKTNKFIISSYATSYFAGIIGACILVTWMYHRVHQGVISYGSLSVIAFLAFQIGMATETLLDLMPTIMAYMASADRVRMLLGISDENKASLTPAEIDGFVKESSSRGISVHVEDMIFSYKNGYNVFDGAFFNANQGEIVALVGASGEGKTTMLRILLGIVTAINGRVYVSNGQREIDLGLNTRPILSYVPQGNTMMAGTILDNMRMVNKNATDSEIKKVLECACIYDFVEKLPEGLNYKIGQCGQGLSEGQNQRLSIARALLKNTPLLLMDEATSALDVNTERRLLENIKKMNPNKTIILTTHRPTVLTMCNRVYKIANKKITIIGEEDIQKLMDEF